MYCLREVRRFVTREKQNCTRTESDESSIESEKQGHRELSPQDKRMEEKKHGT